MIKAGICVAYDWEFLRYSLPAIYNHMDAICLSIDKDRISWNGNTFVIDWPAFTGFLQEIDVHNKIQVLQESFYNTNKKPIENECYQRTRMAETLGKADWYIQIDTDEIVINIAEFLTELERNREIDRPVNIHGVWLNLIKQTATGFIYSVLKTPPLATNTPVYEYGRTNGHFNIYTNLFIAHITWARPEDEVRFKLQNWGHSHEFDGNSFFKMWEALDDYNWRYLKNFHPLDKGSIPQLFFQKSSSVYEFVKNIDISKHSLSSKDLLPNNIWISRLRKMFSKFSLVQS
jgi:hypothetical protein